MVSVRAEVQVAKGPPARTSWVASNIRWDGVSKLSYDYHYTSAFPKGWEPGHHEITFTSPNRAMVSARTLSGSWSARIEMSRASK